MTLGRGPLDLIGYVKALPQKLFELLGHPPHGHSARDTALVKLEASGGDIAEAVRLFQDDIENRRKLADRGVDDLQDFRRRSLLGLRFIQLYGPALELLLQIGERKTLSRRGRGDTAAFGLGGPATFRPICLPRFHLACLATRR